MVSRWKVKRTFRTASGRIKAKNGTVPVKKDTGLVHRREEFTSLNCIAISEVNYRPFRSVPLHGMAPFLQIHKQ